MTDWSVQQHIAQLRDEIKRLYGLIEAERSERIASIASLEGQISAGMSTIRSLLEQLTLTIHTQDLTMQKLFSELKTNVSLLGDRDRLKDDQLHQIRGQIDNLTSQISALTTISAENAASVGLWHTFRADALDLMRGLSSKIDAQGADIGSLRLELARLTTKAAVEARFERRDKARLQAVLRVIKAAIKPQNLLIILTAFAAMGLIGENIIVALQYIFGG